MSGEGNEDVDIMYGLTTVLSQIQAAVARRCKDLPQITPTLVAVSKIKPVPLIVKAYEAGQRHFGENFVNEIAAKANDPEILEKCKDIKWHFIGHLQTNKINKLLGSPGLHIVETVDSEKLATNLNKQWQKICDNKKLKVMIQVNTSGEDVKNGIQPKEASQLVEYVVKSCPNLEFSGLMTIGQYGYDYLTQGPNPDFVCLAKCRQEVCQKLNLDTSNVELSMGMSSDFEHAIELGATTVRVGTNIFGARPPKQSK